jgi:small-conductance mechanosensitive channel
MKSYQRISLIILGLLIAVTGAGLVVTSDWGAHAVSRAKPETNLAQSAVDMRQFQTAQSLAALATTPEEQARARDALRMADHEVDFAFASALYQAASRPIPSTPEISAILARVSDGQKRVAEVTDEIARLTKQVAEAKGTEKDALSQHLDLANARLELNQDELDDANQDLERAGGDPQSRIQRMVDDHKASEQDFGGQVDLRIVGTQAGATLPASSAFLPRVRAWFVLRSMVKNLDQAEQDATTAAAAFTASHDKLEKQIGEAQSQQGKKTDDAHSGTVPGGTAERGTAPQKSSTGAPASTSDENPVQAQNQTRETIAAFRRLSSLQKRMSSLDTRIRNQQDIATNYAQWSVQTSARERGLLHGLFISILWMLLVALAVVATDRLLVRIFDRLQPDRKNLLTLRAVAHFTTRVTGVILILLLIFGAPNQMATVIALAGAGLTVAMKDFIVGFFGWFVLMGKNGIRHGDWVEINGVSGEVVEIGLFYTVLLETGNWNDSGHPTGRRVTFVNSYAIEGHYFNFSTSGQWLWDELDVVLPVDHDPYPVVAEIQKILTKETEANARLAEAEWKQMGSDHGIKGFSAGPAISIRPANPGFEIRVRYVTRANERNQQRSKLYHDIVELLRQKNIPETTMPPAAASS